MARPLRGGGRGKGLATKKKEKKTKKVATKIIIFFAATLRQKNFLWAVSLSMLSTDIISTFFLEAYLLDELISLVLNYKLILYII